MATTLFSQMMFPLVFLPLSEHSSSCTVGLIHGKMKVPLVHYTQQFLNQVCLRNNSGPVEMTITHTTTAANISLAHVIDPTF